MIWYKNAFIELALEKQALKFGNFTLKSGRESPYFFNSSIFSDGKSISLLGKFYAAALQEANLKPTMLFGPAYKGIALATSMAAALYQEYKINTPYCFNRKEAKQHGEGGNIVGGPLKGEIIIIDDVITAGTAVREAIQIIKENSAQAIGLIIALDRQEKGKTELSTIQELQQEFNIKIISLITLQDILNYLPEGHAYKQAILEYKQQYGI